MLCRRSPSAPLAAAAVEAHAGISWGWHQGAFTAWGWGQESPNTHEQHRRQRIQSTFGQLPHPGALIPGCTCSWQETHFLALLISSPFLLPDFGGASNGQWERRWSKTTCELPTVLQISPCRFEPGANQNPAWGGEKLGFERGFETLVSDWTRDFQILKWLEKLQKLPRILFSDREGSVNLQSSFKRTVIRQSKVIFGLHAAGSSWFTKLVTFVMLYKSNKVMGRRVFWML